MTSAAHIVWDWNGTLLDDFPIVVQSVSEALSPFGEGPIDADDYRDHYTRPVKVFYESLFGRPVADEEWLRLNTSFHDSYFRLAEAADLAPGARDSLQRVLDSGIGQSLLSMAPHDWLVKTVKRLGITELFSMVDGVSENTGGLKAPRMERHLDRLDLGDARVFVIGDTPDDVDAARHVGAEAILFHGGSHHMELLEKQGVPIAETIPEAVEMVVSRL